ncbi:MAG: hypothetical protein ACRDPH_16140 [Marmoricola sp.]
MALLAAVMLWWRPPRVVARPMGLLHAVHRSHVGDYVAWVLVGVAALGAGIVR